MSKNNKKEESVQTFKRLLEKYPEPTFLIPTYKSINAHTFQTFTVFFTQLFNIGFKPHIFMLDQTNVCVSRNQLVKYFLEANQKAPERYSCVTWLDSDHTFVLQDWLDLLNAYDEYDEIDVLSANYTTRDMSSPKVCGFTRTNNNFSSLNPNLEGIVKVNAFGFGFCIMDKSILQKMYDEYGLHQFIFQALGDKYEGAIVGEDMDWCEKAEKIGISLYYDMDIVIGHHGSVMDNNVLKMIYNQKKYNKEFTKEE